MSQNVSLINKVTTFPDGPGVYTFVGKNGEILYIGKATSLRSRVRSYFNDDVIATRGRRIVEMVALATDITTISTISVLEALILEAQLIKKHAPKYNAQDKDDKSFNYVVITNESFPQIRIVRGRTLESHLTSNTAQKDIKYTFGPFPSSSSLKIALAIIRRIFPYRDERCVPYDEMVKAGKTPKACFNRQIGLCPGVCTGEITTREYAQNIRNIKLFLEGKKEMLVKQLEKDMNSYAKAMAFEQAAHIKKQIFSLEHINDVALIKHEDVVEQQLIDTKMGDKGSDKEGNTVPVRVEAYDIAHLSGTHTVGVMVVVENGIPQRSEYRKFKIRTNKDVSKSAIDDPKHLTEILGRRLNHPEWPFPHIIVVDGNEIQINAARAVIAERKLDIAVVSIVKDARHRAREMRGDTAAVEGFEKAIIVANSEAHRFALAYHRHLRRKKFADRPSSLK